MIPLLVAAGIFDIKERKIPNHLILSGWLLGLCVRLSADGLTGALRLIAAVLVTIAIGFPLFWIHAIGAGDIKLLSVIGGMHGLRYLSLVFAVWLLLAGTASAVILLRHQMLVERLRHVWLFFAAGRVKDTPYYSRDRDGTRCTIILAPILAAAYILVLAGRWGGFF